MSIKRDLEKLKKGAEYYESIKAPKVDVPASVILSAITARWERHNGSLALDADFEDEKNYGVRKFLEHIKETRDEERGKYPTDDAQKALLARFCRIRESM